MRPESDHEISECMRFFPVYTVIKNIRSVSHEQKQSELGLTDNVKEALVYTQRC